MAFKLLDKDHGYLAKLRAIRSLDGRVKAKAGLIGSAASEQHDDKSGLTTAQIGAIHEFGVGVPERSFIRTWFDENKPLINEKLQELARDVIALNGTIYDKMELFGEWAEGQIRARIEAGISPPNSPATIARKGSDIPLIDTRKLIRAIAHEVARES